MMGIVVKKGILNNIGARLTFWFFILAMLPLIMVNAAVYFHMVNAMKLSIFKNLEAIRDIKVAELDHWLEERITDIRTIAGDYEIQVLERANDVQKEDNQRNIAIISGAREFLKRYLQSNDDLYEIFVVSLHTKKIIVSTDKNHERRKPLASTHFEGALQSMNLFVEEIHYSKTLNKPCFALSIPIFSSADNNRIVGILVARIKLKTSLYKLLSNHVGIGTSGEILIVNRDAIVLNDLRWHKDAPLNLKIKSKDAVDASFGNTGIVETDDYRGEMVLAAYTYIPRTGWGFVVKQDLREVYAPINSLRKWMIAIFITTLVGLMIVTFRVSKSISNPIKELYKGTEMIGSGNLDYKVGTNAKDEIGELSRRFDMMIESVKAITASRDELNKEIAERKHLEKMLLDIREHERRRIGHDLHDNLGQQLTAVSFKAQGLENILRKKMIPEVEDAARITELIEMAKAQVKFLSTGLSPRLDEDEYSLMTAIVDLAANSETLFGILCVVKCNKAVPIIYNKAALIHLYRIAQEAITNAARHAAPSQIEILLSRENDKIILTIKDDGIGFDVRNPKKGIGLDIMRYRAGIINASLDIWSESNRGTVVTCAFLDTRESRADIGEIT